MADPRLTPARRDLAAKHLEGQVEAARFVEGTECEVIDAIAPVRRAPSHDAALDTEALKGERVTIYDRNDEGWAWGQLQSDGYVGWLPESALVAPRSRPTHKVTALRTFAFPGPSIKLPPAESLPLGARVEVVCSGANQDDAGDYRPGLKAAAERQVRHPLQEAGFTKADVRALARAWGLPTWDKPASPCLSSRLVPGLPVTPERTARVEAGEKPEAIRAWLIQRYGRWVSYTPPVDAVTWPLWIAPILLLGIGGLLARSAFRRRRA